MPAAGHCRLPRSQTRSPPGACGAAFGVCGIRREPSVNLSTNHTAAMTAPIPTARRRDRPRHRTTSPTTDRARVRACRPGRRRASVHTPASCAWLWGARHLLEPADFGRGLRGCPAQKTRATIAVQVHVEWIGGGCAIAHPAWDPTEVQRARSEGRSTRIGSIRTRAASCGGSARRTRGRGPCDQPL